MSVKKIILLLLCLCFAAPGGVQAEWITNGAWRLDTAAGNGLPRNFRLCSDAFPDDTEELPSREGFDTLKISGSAQPSGGELAPLYQKLKAQAPTAAIYLLDLREESHGFMNDLAVSWYIKHNRANVGKSQAQVMAEEKAALETLPGTAVTAVPLGKTDTKLFTAYTGRAESVMTEQEAAEKAGFRYMRFAATDQEWPRAELVDAFVDFVKTLPADAWLHFHCHAGHGRTTSFMMMYDILRNPGVPLEDIAKRHHLLGGTDILAGSTKANDKAAAINDRAAKMRAFYEFVQTKDPLQTKVKWSIWLQKE